jgi:hypothetical protein
MNCTGSLPSPGANTSPPRQPHRPVGETVGFVARSDDQARANDRGQRLAILAQRLLFTQCFQRTVELGVGGQRFQRLGHRVGAMVGRKGGGFVGRFVVGGIGRDGRNENVLADMAFQHARRVPDPDRQRGRVVDTDVPVAAFQRLEIVVAVAEQLLDGTGPSLFLAAAVEHRDLVSAFQCVADLMRADKTGAAQDQQAHGFCELDVRQRRPRRSQGRNGGGNDEIAAMHRVTPGL